MWSFSPFQNDMKNGIYQAHFILYISIEQSENCVKIFNLTFTTLFRKREERIRHCVSKQGRLRVFLKNVEKKSQKVKLKKKIKESEFCHFFPGDGFLLCLLFKGSRYLHEQISYVFKMFLVVCWLPWELQS